MNPVENLVVKVPASEVYIRTFNYINSLILELERDKDTASIGQSRTSAITSAQAEAVKKPMV